MFVNYDNSSSESDEEQKKSETIQQKQQEPSQQNNTELPKKRVKLLNFNQVMRKAEEKIIVEKQKSNQNIANDYKKQENKQPIQTSNEGEKDINGKRKLPSVYEEDIKCGIEQKYHKLNDRQEDNIKINNESKEMPTSISTAKQTAPKNQPNKVLFIPPQTRYKKTNVSTEF